MDGGMSHWFFPSLFLFFLVYSPYFAFIKKNTFAFLLLSVEENYYGKKLRRANRKGRNKAKVIYNISRSHFILFFFSFSFTKTWFPNLFTLLPLPRFYYYTCNVIDVFTLIK